MSDWGAMVDGEFQTMLVRPAVACTKTYERRISEALSPPFVLPLWRDMRYNSMMIAIVEAARGVAVFGVLVLLAFLLVPERFLKAVDLDRFTGTGVAVAAIIAGAALSAIFAS